MWLIIILQARAGVCTIDPVRFRLADRTAHFTGWVKQSQNRHTHTHTKPYTHVHALSDLLEEECYKLQPSLLSAIHSFYFYSLLLSSFALLTLSSHHDTFFSLILHLSYLPSSFRHHHFFHLSLPSHFFNFVTSTMLCCCTSMGD